MKDKIGFIQGRLSPIVNGMIQAFPWDNWQQEFFDAHSLDFKLMEWTLDQNKLYKNPLMLPEGQKAIKSLSQKFSLTIPSLTGDCFMQAPFWKASKIQRFELLNDFRNITQASKEIGISIIVIPLVDNGKLENKEQEDILINSLMDYSEFLKKLNIRIAFESDYGPHELATFIERFGDETYGINYDIGNSAALGYDPKEEFDSYCEYILNVHIKDRKLHGTTVPLGAGSANFLEVFRCLSKMKYDGNYILQTARSDTSDHHSPLVSYREIALEWLLKKNY